MVDRRKTSISSIYGEIQFKKYYYRDREKGEHVFLLDRFLEFEGEGGFSPLVEVAVINSLLQVPIYHKAELLKAS